MIFDYHTKRCHLLPIRKVKRGSPAVSQLDKNTRSIS
jgi:hypothetical protein